jgi:WD40 repeat protein
MKLIFSLVLLCISLNVMADTGYAGFSPSAAITYFSEWGSGFTTITDVKTGTILQTLKHPDVSLRDITFSKDEKKIIILQKMYAEQFGEDVLNVIEIATGKILFQLEKVKSAIFSPNGTFVYVTKNSGETVELDAKTGTLLRTIATSLDDTSSFNPVISNDGKIALISIINDAFQVIDLQSGKVLKTIRRKGILIGNEITNVAISQDSNRVYFSYREDSIGAWGSEAEIIELNSDKKIQMITCDLGCSYVRFFSNDKMLFLGGKRGGDVIAHVAKPEQIHSKIKVDRIAVRSFSPDDKFMAVTTRREVDNVFKSFIEVYDLATALKVKMIPRTKESGEFLSCSFSSNGKEIIAILEDGSLEKYMFP